MKSRCYCDFTEMITIIDIICGVAWKTLQEDIEIFNPVYRCTGFGILSFELNKVLLKLWFRRNCYKCHLKNIVEISKRLWLWRIWSFEPNEVSIQLCFRRNDCTNKNQSLLDFGNFFILSIYELVIIWSFEVYEALIQLWFRTNCGNNEYQLR